MKKSVDIYNQLRSKFIEHLNTLLDNTKLPVFPLIEWNSDEHTFTLTELKKIDEVYMFHTFISDRETLDTDEFWLPLDQFTLDNLFTIATKIENEK